MEDQEKLMLDRMADSAFLPDAGGDIAMETEDWPHEDLLEILSSLGATEASNLYSMMNAEGQLACRRALQGVADGALVVSIQRFVALLDAADAGKAVVMERRSTTYDGINPLARMMYCRLTDGVDLDGTITWKKLIAASIAMAAAFTNDTQLATTVDFTQVRADLETLEQMDADHDAVLQSLKKEKRAETKYFSAAYVEEFGRLKGFSLREQSITTPDTIVHKIVSDEITDSRMFVADAAAFATSISAATGFGCEVIPADQLTYYILGFIHTQFTVSYVDKKIKVKRTGAPYAGPFKQRATVLTNLLAGEKGLSLYSISFPPISNMAHSGDLKVYVHYLVNKMLLDTSAGALGKSCTAPMVTKFLSVAMADYRRIVAPYSGTKSVMGWIEKQTKMFPLPVNSLSAAVKENKDRREVENVAVSPLFVTADACLKRPVGVTEALYVKVAALVQDMPDVKSIDVTGTDGKIFPVLDLHKPNAVITAYASTKASIISGAFTKWNEANAYPNVGEALIDDSGGTEFATDVHQVTKVTRLLNTDYKYAVLRFTLNTMCNVVYNTSTCELPFGVEKLLTKYTVAVVSPGKAHSSEFFVICTKRRADVTPDLIADQKALVTAFMAKMILMHAASGYRAYCFDRGVALRLTSSVMTDYGGAVLDAAAILRYAATPGTIPHIDIEDYFHITAGATTAQVMDMSAFASGFARSFSLDRAPLPDAMEGDEEEEYGPDGRNLKRSRTEAEGPEKEL